MKIFVGELSVARTTLKIVLLVVCLVFLSQIISAQNTYTTHSNLSYVNDGNISHKLVFVRSKQRDRASSVNHLDSRRRLAKRR